MVKQGFGVDTPELNDAVISMPVDRAAADIWHIINNTLLL